jgi:EAL domain-containing protein (putative c-di-GMP-specific phosphodiesterase class I)/integral membrane sensor domain MASE1
MKKLDGPFALENLVIAILVFSAALCSRLLSTPDHAVSILWPPTALMLGYCLQRGPRGLPGAALGIAAWAGIAGHSASGMFLIAAATTVPPWFTCSLINRWQADSPAEANIRSTIRQLFLACVVQSPLAALLGALSMADQPLAEASFSVFTAGYLLIEVTSSLVFAPLALLWIPKYEPAPERRQATRKNTLAQGLDWPTFAYLLVTGLACLYVHSQGFTAVARLLIFAAIFGPLFSSLSRGSRASSLTLALAAIMVLGMRAYLYRGEPLLIIGDGLVPAWLMTAVGAIFVHLLSALSVERTRQTRLIRNSAMKSEIAGLISARALHLFLGKLTAAAIKKPFRVVEIFIPEVLRAGELMGRTAMLALEAQAGARLKEHAGPRASVIAHLSTGRFALITPITVSDVRLLRLVNEALQNHSFKVAGRLFRLRPSVGLIDVIAGTKTHPEAVLAALSLAQQRAFNSAERFQKFPLGSRELKQVWAELDLEESVKRALHEKRVVLMAQLIAPCHRDEETAGLHYEILARMLDEKGNVMSPASFLPAIARAGLSREFDRLIIESTFDYLATDKALCARTAACAINVTGRMISSPELPSLIKIQLQRTGLSPALFVIEITESESIDDIEEAKANARELKRMGITVAVDDFGTGLATFDYLKQFKPQILKIDGSFIRTFDDSPLDRAIVQSIVRVAATIGARTVAEWVETEDLGRKLRGLGVDFLQGYAIAKPVPIGQLGALRQDPAFLGAPSASSVSGDRRASAAALIHLPEPA